MLVIDLKYYYKLSDIFRQAQNKPKAPTIFLIQIESWQHESDDTALNGIRLECASKEGGFGGTIHSGEGAWGSWIQEDVKTCDSRNGVPHFLTGFALAVEEYQVRKKTCS